MKSVSERDACSFSNSILDIKANIPLRKIIKPDGFFGSCGATQRVSFYLEAAFHRDF